MSVFSTIQLSQQRIKNVLNDHEFEAWCLSLALSAQAKQCIADIRASPPVRRVQSAVGNVSGRYPSQKMAATIQFESHRLELAVIYELEHDPDVLAYFDQPNRMVLRYQHSNGTRLVTAKHTPDFFVIRQQSAEWLECKMEDQLAQLAEKMPHRYVQHPDGTWRCPPGEAYATELGLCYRVYSSRAIDWVYQRNIRFLEDYLRPPLPAPVPEVVKAIQALVASKPGISLRDLLSVQTAWADTVYTMIATSVLYVDIRAVPLAEPERVSLFLDRQQAQLFPSAGKQPDMRPHVLDIRSGTSVLWDGTTWNVLNIGNTTVALLSAHGDLLDVPHEAFCTLMQQGKLQGVSTQHLEGKRKEAHTRLAQASPSDLQEANRRYAFITGSPPASQMIPRRTLQRWQKRFRDAEITYEHGYIGLLPRVHEKGNRQKKLPEQAETLLETFITNDYETLTQKPKYEVYAAFVRQAKREQLSVIPSYKTFLTRIKQRPREVQVLKRQGPRAAAQHAPFFWELALTTPRHGDRPLEIGHLDHTELDIVLVSARTGRLLGRPWVTFLTDAFTRRLLACYLTFDPPSYRSCMMTLRECVWRYGRFPQTLVVDGGREFDSTYFETLTAYYACTKKTRPWAQPRYGSVCERLFGTANAQFVHNLIGNTQLMRQVRQVTKSISPEVHATWNLGDLYHYLQIWAYTIYDTAVHSALGQAPEEAFRLGQALMGERTHRHIRYDDEFRMLTLPTTRKGEALVEPGRGVKINYLYYWSDAFRAPAVERTLVPIRYDPFDIGLAYAFVQGRWVQCLSEYYLRLRGHSERELRLASAELRKRYQNHASEATITAQRLADLLADAQAHEAVLTQRLQDLEARDVFAQMAGSRLLQEDQPRQEAGSTALPAAHAHRSTGLPSEEQVVVEDDLENLEEYGEYR